ncbi:Hypothetical predicted protein [Paramuricea clavata]|uniref:Uncharacterized protein n=1 Tax=Paramuricea clavata TaxID=317549 RepID=A0A6S7LRE4_PARCT|nr:Hypothetical predicted protein [Paramuricea clavata]
MMITNWRANVDLQVIVDEKACARYMAKYAAKGEPRSKSASEILKLSVSSLQNDDQVSSAFKKAMIQVAGDRDMAAQETAHMLLSLPLIGCTFSFVTISLDNSRKVNIDAENEGDEYTKVRGELTKQANPYIVRTFPKISANPAGPDFGKYCKYQLMKFKPWEGQPSSARNNEDESDQMFINAYEFFLMTDEFAEENVFRLRCLGERVHDAQCGQTFENDPSDNQDDDNESEVDPDEEEIDDWILLWAISRCGHYIHRKTINTKHALFPVCNSFRSGNFVIENLKGTS